MKAHFDGTFLVPDEPVNLPINQPLHVVVSSEDAAEPPASDATRRLRALEAATGILSGPVLSDESLRRENIYDEGA